MVGRPVTNIPVAKSKSKPKPKVLIGLNTAWNFINFRSGLIRSLVEQGYEVVAVAPDDHYAARVAGLGCRFVPLPMDNRGTHLGRDALLLWRYWRLLAIEKPDVYLGFTVKPNVYGSLAAHWLGIPVINNIAGLGSVFIRGGWLVRIVHQLYRISLARSAKVFFQNEDDRQLFVRTGLVDTRTLDLLPGSGIDLVRFNCTETNSSLRKGAINDGSVFRFLLISRMLWDKGVGEYVAAAKMVREHWPQVECCLLGSVDVPNPSAISSAEMAAWIAAGDVVYLGVSDDVRAQIAMADCVVLPSYREGTPRALLEAAAMGKPIIATDAVGCREVVDDGVTGYLCRVRDTFDLADKMEKMLEISPLQRRQMGAHGRRKMEREFDERFVIDKYLSTIGALVS